MYTCLCGYLVLFILYDYSANIVSNLKTITTPIIVIIVRHTNYLQKAINSQERQIFQPMSKILVLLM